MISKSITVILLAAILWSCTSVNGSPEPIAPGMGGTGVTDPVTPNTDNLGLCDQALVLPCVMNNLVRPTCQGMDCVCEFLQAKKKCLETIGCTNSCNFKGVASQLTDFADLCKLKVSPAGIPNMQKRWSEMLEVRMAV